MREPAPKGARLGFARAGLAEGRGGRSSRVFGFGGGLLLLPKFPLYRCYLKSREGRRVNTTGIPPAPLKSVFIRGTKSPLPLCSRPRVSLGTFSQFSVAGKVPSLLLGGLFPCTAS